MIQHFQFCVRKWQPTPVLLTRKFHGWRSLVGYSPWGHKESDTTEQLHDNKNTNSKRYLHFHVHCSRIQQMKQRRRWDICVMYGCESWTVKKVEHRRIDAFELWCWRRLLRVPWTARRSNWSILKEISSGCSWEGLMLKLKLQYFGHLMWRVDSLEKILMLGGIGSRRKRGRQRMRWLECITDSMDMSLGELRELVIDREAWRAVIIGSQRVRHDWAIELN